MQEQEKIVSYVLLKIGVSAHFVGFRYLKQALLHVLENGNLMSMGELYDIIAEFYRKSWGKVERGMRYAIETVFNKGNTELLSNLFNDFLSTPTNANFIYTVAEYIRLVLTENHQYIDELKPLLLGDSVVYMPLPENRESSVKLLPKPVVINEESKNIEKDLLKIVSGYLYMTLEDLKYSAEDMQKVIQILEINVNHNHYESAIAEYERAESEYAPVKIDDIVIPSKYNDLRISELPFSTSPMGVRITNSLLRVGITFIKDFRNKEVGFSKIRCFGAGSLVELKAALRREIGGD